MTNIFAKMVGGGKNKCINFFEYLVISQYSNTPSKYSTYRERKTTSFGIDIYLRRTNG